MKLKELKEKLLAVPESWDDVEVWIARDEEGNGFNPFAHLDATYAVAEDDELFFYEADEAEDASATPVLVLWP